MSRYGIMAPKLKPGGPYSHAVATGSLVFLSGQVPMDHTTGKLVDGDIAAQTRQVFANLRAVLKASDLTFDDVVKVTVYMTDLSEFEAMNKVYQEHFKEPYPARTTIGVAQLPRGSKIEIEMIAEGGPLAA